SVLEVSVLAGAFTAEFGRASGGIVNVAGRRGGSTFHGSAYAFNRTSSLTSNSFHDNAGGVHEPSFRRNQFGGAVGGPILGNRLYFFGNTEATLVRSQATQQAWVVNPQFLAQTAPNTQAFFATLGQWRPDARVIGTANLSQLTAIFGRSPCLGLLCASLSPTLPLFSHLSWQVPGDSGGGVPQNTWNSYNRIDYVASSRTRIYARYQNFGEHDQRGVLSTSPYAGYDLRQQQQDNSVLISAIHEWNLRWVSQTSIAFDRLTLDQQGLTGRGVVPTMYANPVSPVTIGPDAIAFPGYNPFSPGAGGAYGGPQNIGQINHETGWLRGRHDLRFGGSYVYLRDNRTDAAYQTAADSLSNTAGLGGALIGLLFGKFAQIQVAVDPQGQFPCRTAATCFLQLPANSPNFSRSNRFHDAALYAQDHWLLTRHIALDLGVRWDYFGVQHNGNPALDSNWYAANIGSGDDNLIRYLVFGGLQRASSSPIGGLYQPDWNNFAPRAGASWDVTGDGRTTLRAGYGIGFDRNFGNVTFNVHQNLPNHAVLSVPGSITTDNFGPLGSSSGSIALPAPGARIINPWLKTAFAHFWNASVQREITRRITYNFQYSGSRGVDLYSVSYPNQKGFRNFRFGDFCTGNGDCRTSPNPYYSEEVGYRGNQGSSTYYSLDNRVSVNNLFGSGLSLTAGYTWSHAVDNLSSTFFEAGGRGIPNRYGDRNITTNNGNFVAGFLDPFQPELDRGDAEFDVRHRVVVSGNWTLPGLEQGTIGRAVLKGWNLAPVFLARSGQPFSV
ncbi:MAG TPA: TonB-dependent receptor, partial [Bryobacteraceae bacterium]|nr:TonB-dependent receptor [Bryobacteraceae bacterium]